MNESSAKKIIAALRKKREADGLSIRALASLIGISFSTLARIERGEGEPDNNSTIRILNWLSAGAEDFGLSYQDAALVHFRAAKNVSSKTIHCLLQVADKLKVEYLTSHAPNDSKLEENISDFSPTISLSKDEMEDMADSLRIDIGVELDEPLDALSIAIQDVDVIIPNSIKRFDSNCIKYLTTSGSSEWSAMSVPLDSLNTKWAIFRNDTHLIERQRVTYLEECWHILLGHKLTRIAKFADSYGRTYDSDEEHDAYYLASATMLPKSVIEDAVKNKISAKITAMKYGTSIELVEYRIKRLGLWRAYKEISVSLK